MDMATRRDRSPKCNCSYRRSRQQGGRHHVSHMPTHPARGLISKHSLQLRSSHDKDYSQEQYAGEVGLRREAGGWGRGRGGGGEGGVGPCKWV